MTRLHKCIYTVSTGTSPFFTHGTTTGAPHWLHTTDSSELYSKVYKFMSFVQYRSSPGSARYNQIVGHTDDHPLALPPRRICFGHISYKAVGTIKGITFRHKHIANTGEITSFTVKAIVPFFKGMSAWPYMSQCFRWSHRFSRCHSSYSPLQLPLQLPGEWSSLKQLPSYTKPMWSSQWQRMELRREDMDWKEHALRHCCLCGKKTTWIAKHIVQIPLMQLSLVGCPVPVWIE